MTKDLITLANISIDNPPLVDFPEGVKWSDFPENKRKLIIEYLITTQKNNKNFKSYSHIPCKFFKKGKCQAGRSCPFSHDLDYDQACNTPCSFFLKGECKFGKNCLNLHEYPKTTQIPPTTSSTNQLDSIDVVGNMVNGAGTNSNPLSSTIAQFSMINSDPFTPTNNTSLPTTLLPSIPHYNNAPTLFNADPLATIQENTISKNNNFSLWGNTNIGPVVGGNNTHGKKLNYYNNNYYDFNDPITRPLHTTPTNNPGTDNNNNNHNNNALIKPEDVKFFLNKNSQN